jgi:YVTN family beta-propeller protein
MIPHTPIPRALLAGATLLALSACGPRSGAPSTADTPDSGAGTTLHPRLPTGVYLDPAGTSSSIGQLPLAMIASPNGGPVVLLLNGYTTQGVQVIDRSTGAVLQTLEQPAAFLGLAFSPDGSTLYASGGNQDVVYRYAWAGGRATLRDSLVIEHKEPRRSGRRYPAGIGVSPDGARLYVAENLTDSLSVVDVASGRVVQRLATGRYPYGVVVGRDGAVYVSAWGGDEVSVFTPRADGSLASAGEIPAGRHPSALLLNADGSRLFAASGSTDRVTVIDTRARRPVRELLDPPPAGPGEGSTPNALALSSDGTRLFAAEADANAVAVFDLSAATSGVPGARGDDRLAGRIPVGWYPTAVLATGDTLLVVNGKGRGTAPNPDGPQPIVSREHQGSGRDNTLRQLSGTVTVLPGAGVAGEELAALTARVARANGWDRPARTTPRYPPFQHVIYIIKENRTYDQVLGDLAEADGDTSLLFFPRPVSPNQHALAERFGVFDRFFVNAEVSADGHNWSTAAYASDYVEKTVESNYSGRGRSYDYEGTNRGKVPDDDVNEPASGYLWNLAERKGITFRNFGEFVVPEAEKDADDLPAGYRGDKPYLARNTNPRFPGFDLAIPDQRRADVWLEEFHEWERSGSMPALQIVRLPNDHTSGARAGMPTPRAAMADNDLALGRVIEALTSSRFWPSTVVFVLEDDAQNGPDHVDSHRSPLLVISAWNRSGVVHRFANTSDVLLTIEEILGLQSLSQFDHFGRPLREIWADRPDTRPYHALTPSVPLDERNPGGTALARASARLDLDIEDSADDDTFNRILWATIKGTQQPYPGPTRMSALEARRGG